MGFVDRLATAPISWGICEVPGWGRQLPVDRVLAEMRALGFPATELGSDGYLPVEPEELLALLGSHDLSLLAAFVPAIIHDPAAVDETLGRMTAMAAHLQRCGAIYFNTAPVMSWDWGPRRPLNDDEWAHAMAMLDRIEEITADHGLTQVVHEHVGTVIETAEDIQRLVDSSPVRFVLDTAHFAIGGFDPVDFVDRHPDRVGLVHLKDCRLDIADRLNGGELTLMEAVQNGIFPSIGQGDLKIDHVVATLERRGYQGWYVLEQDAAITGDEPPAGAGPLQDMTESVRYLRRLDERLAA